MKIYKKKATPNLLWVDKKTFSQCLGREPMEEKLFLNNE
jgi:hypothetical protein